MPFHQCMCFSHPHIISKWHPGSRVCVCVGGGGGNKVSKAKMCNFLKFSMTKISTVLLWTILKTSTVEL